MRWWSRLSTPHPSRVCKVFEVDTLGLDFGCGCVAVVCFVIPVLSSKEWCRLKEGLPRGLKPLVLGDAFERPRLKPGVPRSNCNNKDNDNSRSPSGMTTRGARQEQKQIPPRAAE